MGITLILALVCTNAQAQSSPQTTSGQQARKPAVPLYYQMGQGNAPTGQTRAEADALARARAEVANLTHSIQNSVGPHQENTRGLSAVPSTTPGVNPPPNPPSMELLTNPSLNPATGLVKLDPNSVPANSPLNKAASPEEEKAAQYLQEQSKKMQESLKDMELSN